MSAVVVTGASSGIGRATALTLAKQGFDSQAHEVAEQAGDAGLAGLVNNAGTTVPGPVEYLSLQTFRQQLEVNLVGPPNPDGTVQIIGGTGDFTGISGTFRELSWLESFTSDDHMVGRFALELVYELPPS